MSIEIGQDISSILGTQGSYIGNSNTLGAQCVISQLGSGFSSEGTPSNPGIFNSAAAGLKTGETASAPSPAPVLAQKFGL